MGLGLAVGIVAWVIGIIGLVSIPNPHLLPIPNAVTAFGACALMGTLLLLVITSAHTTRGGDIDWAPGRRPARPPRVGWRACPPRSSRAARRGSAPLSPASSRPAGTTSSWWPGTR